MFTYYALNFIEIRPALSATTATADAAIDRPWCNTDMGRVWARYKVDSLAYEPAIPLNGYGISTYFTYVKIIFFDT